MTDAILVLNAGSSSIKFLLFADRSGELEPVVRGQIEGLGTAPRFVARDGAGKVIAEKSWGEGVKLGHEGGIAHLAEFFQARAGEFKLEAVGHRVVHGGLEYSQPVRVDAGVLA